MNTCCSPQTSTYTAASFSWRNRLARVAWNLACLMFFRFSPRPFHSWRSFILRLFGAKLGSSCHIYPKAVIWAPWNLVCHDQAAVADHAILYNQAEIVLGRRAVVSQGAHLCTGTHNYQSPSFELVARPIHIEELAWICAECFVCPGVDIGQGAVIGARSVVTSSMPPWMVCAGHPCAPIKPRVIHSQ